MATLHLIIQGQVQGVFYRDSAKKKAQQMGITGWVKNTPEKNVEIMASGTMDQLLDFVEWCNQGPPRARVDIIKSHKVDDQRFDDFKILH